MNKFINKYYEWYCKRNIFTKIILYILHLIPILALSWLIGTFISNEMNKMTGIEFLIILAAVCIVLIVGIIIVNTIIYVNLTDYHKKWEPIYENRKEHFDVYLKEALENSKSTESIYSIAKLASRLRLEEEQKELKGYELEEFELHYDSKLENYIYEYVHELRSAGLE
jgi:cell division protein FtsL